MNGTLRMLTATAALTTLSACASVSDNCDPTTGGLIGAIGCDASGRYDQRLQERQSQQAALMARKADLIKQQQALEAEQATVAQQLGAQEAELTKAQRELAAVRQRLQTELARKKELQASEKTLEKRVTTSQGDIATLKQAEAQRQAKIVELQREQRNLTKEYDAATGK